MRILSYIAHISSYITHCCTTQHRLLFYLYIGNFKPQRNKYSVWNNYNELVSYISHIKNAIVSEVNSNLNQFYLIGILVQLWYRTIACMKATWQVCMFNRPNYQAGFISHLSKSTITDSDIERQRYKGTSRKHTISLISINHSLLDTLSQYVNTIFVHCSVLSQV